MKNLFFTFLGIGMALIILTYWETSIEIITLFITEEFIIFDLKTALYFIILFSIVGILTILIRKAIIILGNDQLRKEEKESQKRSR